MKNVRLIITILLAILGVSIIIFLLVKLHNARQYTDNLQRIINSHELETLRNENSALLSRNKNIGVENENLKKRMGLHERLVDNFRTDVETK